MKRFKFGVFLSSISYWIGYIIESLKLGYNYGKNDAQGEV